MRERLLRAASGLARLVLVVVAFGLAVGSIAVSSVRGFCPEPDDRPLAMSALAPVVVDATDTDPSEEPATDGECPGGVQRCLPPLFSSVLLLGEPACNEQAGARLRDTLVPAFVGSTILFAGAWWLRPTRLHGSREEPAPAE